MKGEKKLVISGSRTITDRQVINDIMHRYKCDRFTYLIHGTARGVDKIAEDWGVLWGMKIIAMPADWDKYGKPAGMIRNKEMADLSDACLAIWDGSSPGTKNMIEYYKTLGKPLIVEIV